MHIKFIAGAAALALSLPVSATANLADAVTALKQYNVIIFDDMSASHDVEGKTFVGGSITGHGTYGFGSMANTAQHQGQASSLPILSVVGSVGGNVLNGADGNGGARIGTPPSAKIGGNWTGGDFGGFAGGTIEVGGNATTNAPSGTTFNVGGSFSGGNPGAVNANLGSAFSTPLIDSLEAQRTKLIGDLTLLSSTLNGYATTAGSGIDFSDWNNVKVTAVAGADGFAVLNVDAADLFNQSKVKAISYSFAAGLTTVINVHGAGSYPGETGGWSFNTLGGSAYNSSVLFNFADATGLDINRMVHGSILAPFATLANTNTPIEGSVVARIFKQGGEVHLGNFAGDIYTTTPVEAVPEPATWAMLIAGFGLVGTAARRRRTTALRAIA